MQNLIKIFGLGQTEKYAEEVASLLKITITPHIEQQFDDGEMYVQSTDDDIGNVRGCDTFVIHSLYSDEKESVSDKFMKLCIMCGSLKDASAKQVIPVILHVLGGRQDRKTRSRAPITTKYVARMLESCGIDRALFIDLHNLAAQQNAFSVPIDNLEVKNLHADWCVSHLRNSKKIRVLSPDAGGLSRCTRFRNTLTKKLGEDHENNIEVVHFDKVRDKGKVIGGRVIGDINGADVIVYDDMISTGSTMKKACRAVLQGGGRLSAIMATHGLFCGEANQIFNEIDVPIVISDTVQPFRLNENNRKKVHVVSTTMMIANAIWRIHSGTGSISELLKD
jgi:ribose-phosphate pyrophosphokinase